MEYRFRTIVFFDGFTERYLCLLLNEIAFSSIHYHARLKQIKHSQYIRGLSAAIIAIRYESRGWRVCEVLLSFEKSNGIAGDVKR